MLYICRFVLSCEKQERERDGMRGLLCGGRGLVINGGWRESVAGLLEVLGERGEYTRAGNLLMMRPIVGLRETQKLMGFCGAGGIDSCSAALIAFAGL